MGVMTCDRMGCDNTMCDYHHEEHGFICSPCKEELIEFLNADSMASIYNFMDTFKDPDLKQGLGKDLFNQTFKFVWFKDIIPVE